MAEQDQQKWLKGFSRVGFLFPQIYLLRARQYWFFVIVFIITGVSGFFNQTVVGLIALAIAIFIGIKGRKLAFAKTKKSFEDFKNGYRKFSKILMYILIPLTLLIIIGIFAAALLPRLSGAQGRAYDVARKADIQQTATALIMYQIDNGTYPNSPGSLDRISEQLLVGGLSSIPSDPNPNTSFNGLISISGTPGQYMYIPLNKSGDITEGFALIAKTETEGGSNRVFDKNASIENMIDVNSIKTCDTFMQTSYTKNMNDGTCYYISTGDLGFIYKYK